MIRVTVKNVEEPTTVKGLVSVDDGGASVTVDDGGGSITIDGAVTVRSDVATGGLSVVRTDDEAGDLQLAMQLWQQISLNERSSANNRGLELR